MDFTEIRANDWEYCSAATAGGAAVIGGSSVTGSAHCSLPVICFNLFWALRATGGNSGTIRSLKLNA